MMAQSYACPIGPYGEKGYQHERRTKNVRNRQISRRMDTHGIIVVERFATFHYY